MSKIGRKSISLDGVHVEVSGNKINYKGPHAMGTYELPADLKAVIENNQLTIVPAKEYSSISKKLKRKINRIWGLHRALLSNEIKGAAQEFTKKIEIDGLGYKATKSGSGKKLEFSLGYSHKIDFDLPEAVSVEIDKSGKKLTVKSFDKFLMGKICSDIQSLRLPEPYKGTGIKLENQEIRRKAGKTKAA